jgi:predicted nuclease of predicted toxin-antitoxin system
MSALRGGKIESSGSTSRVMIILDAHISPGLALWISSVFQIECCSAKFLDLQEADDKQIFFFARTKNAIVITKDDDFVSLLNRNGSPPKIIWLTCGNTSRERLREILALNLTQALDLLQTSELVEITGR